ncbi:ABC transporter substrate-binding protein [Patescibacteria group bacterium]|jgi:peptide/nickel transport system substrate-binding protein|nr:ABC transporter substrate-binding protein [Patescibacteria group bacterium]
MFSIFDRFRSAWNKVFFWQTPSAGSSEEFTPHPHADHALVLAVTSPKRVPRWKQLRFINRVLVGRERGLFWGALAVGIIAFGVGLTDIVRTRTELVPAGGGVFTEAVEGTPKLINPLFAPANDVDRDLVALVFSGLFRLDGQLNAVPDLVKDYHWLENGKTLEVILREDARFHDGQPVTAHDVVFTYEAAKNQEWRSLLYSTFRDVVLIEVDEHTVQFQLPSANPLFLNDLTVGILPAHIWEEGVTPSNAHLADANLKPIGSGPYRVVSYTRDGRGNILHFHLARFGGYYGIQPFIEEVRFRFYPDRDQALQAVTNGQADAVAFVSWSEAESVRGEHLRTASLDLPRVTGAFFNTKDKLLKDEKLRQALAMAVDSAELAALVGDRAKPVNSPFPFLNDASSTVPDLDGARAQLDKLGWKLAEGTNVRTNASSTLTITIDVPNQPDLIALAELLKRRWSLIGAQVDVRADEDMPLLRNALATRAYQVLVWNILIPADQNLAQFWGSAYAGGSRGFNLSNLADRDVDAALERTRTATTTAELTDAQMALSQAIKKRTPALLLLRPSEAYLIASRVKGVSDMRISRPSDRFVDLQHWYVNERRQWK